MDKLGASIKILILLFGLTTNTSAFVQQRIHSNLLPSYTYRVVRTKSLRPSTHGTENSFPCRATYKLSKIDNEEEEVKVGTQEYYAGFISRDLKEAEERVAGDKVLIPTLKFVGGFTVLIGLLLVGFLASNGII